MPRKGSDAYDLNFQNCNKCVWIKNIVTLKVEWYGLEQWKHFLKREKTLALKSITNWKFLTCSLMLSTTVSLKADLLPFWIFILY